ncbi:hypothetical protein D9M71_375410 [compost metagenome]
MLLARRQLHFAHADVGRIDLELQAVAVEVIAVGVDEAQAHLLAAALLDAQTEGFGDRKEIALGGTDRADPACRGGRFVEKASAGGQDDQQQDQGQQAAHEELAVSGIAE